MSDDESSVRVTLTNKSGAEIVDVKTKGTFDPATKKFTAA